MIFIGTGSSRFAAVAAAALLRSRGVDAVAELASTGSPTPPSADTLAVGISASGKTAETIEALLARRGASECIAITNDPQSELAASAAAVLPLFAGEEEGGVACLTYQATVAVLLLLAGRLLGDGRQASDLRPAVEAGAQHRAGRGEWIDEVVGLVDGARSIATIAPAERLSSALLAVRCRRPRVGNEARVPGGRGWPVRVWCSDEHPIFGSRRPKRQAARRNGRCRAHCCRAVAAPGRWWRPGTRGSVTAL